MNETYSNSVLKMTAWEGHVGHRSSGDSWKPEGGLRNNQLCLTSQQRLMKANCVVF